MSGVGSAAVGSVSWSSSGSGSGSGLACGVSGIAGRLPSRVLEHIFSYLDLSDLACCSLVCWHWNNCLADENSEVWRSQCARLLNDEALRTDILCNLGTYKGKVRVCRFYFSFMYCLFYRKRYTENVKMSLASNNLAL